METPFYRYACIKCDCNIFVCVFFNVTSFAQGINLLVTKQIFIFLGLEVKHNSRGNSLESIIKYFQMNKKIDLD